jgi:nicotinic acid mononucleotide adenylyltransferase
MCNLAAEQTSSWLMVDPWEAFQSYQRTAVVLDHFEHEINDKLGGVATSEGEMRPVRVLLLAGSDLIATMSEPGVWSQADVGSPSLVSGFVITPPHFPLCSWLTFSASTDASLLSEQDPTWTRRRIA